MRRDRRPPETAQESCDDDVLFRFLPEGAKVCARFAAFEEHRTQVFVRIDQTDRGVAVPEPQARDLVFPSK